MNKYRFRHRNDPIPPHEGSVHFYDNWKCRCDGCSEAKKQKMRDYRKRLLMEKVSRGTQEDRPTSSKSVPHLS